MYFLTRLNKTKVFQLRSIAKRRGTTLNALTGSILSAYIDGRLEFKSSQLNSGSSNKKID